VFFLINGVAVYRFAKPPFWFIWFVQKLPFSIVLFVVSTILSILTIALSIPLVVTATNAITSGQYDTLALYQGAFIVLFVAISSRVLRSAYDAIRQRRIKISQGDYRKYYVVPDDYSSKIMFHPALHGEDVLPPEVMTSAFGDKSVIEADQRLRTLNYSSVMDLQLIRLRKKGVLYTVQGTLLQHRKASREALNYLVGEHGMVDAVTNQYAEELVAVYERASETLVDLIEEVERERLRP